MPDLVTVADVLEVLDQVDQGNGEYDVLLADLCARAQDTVELYLGFTFDGYTTATTAVVYGKGTPWLTLPPHEAGSITHVTIEPASGGTASDITGWAEQSDGSIYLLGYAPDGRGWYPMTRYVVTANFGYGTDWPEAVRQVGIELVINMFKERTKGMFSDVIGVDTDGGTTAVGYTRAWTNRQKDILDRTKRKYRGLVIA
jgi:hypothetical protein